MQTKYIDLIEQTFDFPQNEFKLVDHCLKFHELNLMELIEKHGTPLKFNYLPRISENINACIQWFNHSIKKTNYTGNYFYSYCTKSSHFSFILEEVLKNKVHLETSSAVDISIIQHLYKEGKIKKGTYIICNGYKTQDYISKIGELIDQTSLFVISVIDNTEELSQLLQTTDKNINIGIRIASEESPQFTFYTSRLGIRYKDIVPFFKEKIKSDPRVNLTMLHFFINTGINDNSYYWSELTKCLKVYSELKKINPALKSLNIGGGFPIKNSLGFDFDYQYIIKEIIKKIKKTCNKYKIKEPDIFTEFGSFTVGESGGAIFEVIHQKQQNDREKWNMINSSFMTNLPDTWSINKRFIMLPINRWNKDYEHVLLGGLTCDSDDFYNSEQHTNSIYLPKYVKEEPLFIGFFNTGAYQESIGGYGGLKHCLIPEPKHVIIKKDSTGNITTEVFNEEQSPQKFLSILGYNNS